MVCAGKYVEVCACVCGAGIGKNEYGAFWCKEYGAICRTCW